MIEVRRVNQFLARKGMSKPLQSRDEGRFGEQVPELGGDVTGMLVRSIHQASIQFRRQSRMRPRPRQCHWRRFGWSDG